MGGGDKAATRSEVILVSERINTRMAELDGVQSYFKLFKRMDTDGSGRIGWYEFNAMIRRELRIGPSILPERRLKAVWLTFDTDRNGSITAGEFSAFMTKGEGARRRMADEARVRATEASVRYASRGSPKGDLCTTIFSEVASILR